MRTLTKNISEKLSVELIEIIWDFYEEKYIGITMDDY